MLSVKKITVAAITVGVMSFVTSAYATVVTYTDRATFESDLQDIVIDDFNSAAYSFVNTAVGMKTLSLGSIGYEGTGFGINHNLVSGQRLCWGCNGSGQILLGDTTIGTSDGVYGFGLDIIRSSANPQYDAFVTFGDGSTQNIDLGAGSRFFGITSGSLIKQVHFGLTGGGVTTSGSFQVDNVTIGNKVPEPAPMALLGLGLLGFGLARRRRG